MEQSTEYRVTVTRIQRDVPYIAKSWERVRSDDKNDPTGQYRAYDYVETESVKDVDTKVFEQTLDDIDLGGLAVFINTQTLPVIKRGDFDGSKSTQN